MKNQKKTKSNWQGMSTFLLLVVTVFYTFFTYSMVIIMKNQFNLAYDQIQKNDRPYVFIDKFDLDPKQKEGYQEGHQYVLVMKNSGNVPATGRIEKFCYNNENNCNNPESNIFIFPDSDGIKIGPPGDYLSLKKEINTNKEIKLIYRINYWAVDDVEKEKIYFYEVHIKLYEDIKNPSNILYTRVYMNAN